jgi:hypothetical protein
VDRFYNRAEGLDRDWVLADSVRQAVPQWGSDEMLTSAFSDAGHPSARGITVRQRGLGLTDPALSGCVVLVYDVWNHGASALNGAYAGVIADFDVKATDRLHDFARTAPELATAWMRSVTVADRVCGVKLLAPAAPAHVGCIDHARYVYPDSGLSEDMKYRILTGGLGASQGDRPFNWSVSAGFGPFDIEPNGGRQRLAFAFIAAEDSVSYLAACQACQQWYDTHVGVADAVSPAGVRRLAVSPNPFGSELLIRCVAEPGTPVEVRAFDACGRLAADIFSGPVVAGRAIRWRPTGLGAGVYVIKAGTSRWTTSTRVLLVR